MLTASVVRSEPVRSRFKVICWLNLSQQPDIMRLQVGHRDHRCIVDIRCLPCQQRCHEQLADSDGIPMKSRETVEQQKDALVKAAEGKNVLLVLDGGGCVCVYDGLSSCHLSLVHVLRLLLFRVSFIRRHVVKRASAIFRRDRYNMRIEASRNNENQESIVEPRSGGRVGAPWSARYELDVLTAIRYSHVFDTRAICRVCRAASRRSRVGRRSGAADVSRDCSALRASPPLFEHRRSINQVVWVSSVYLESSRTCNHQILSESGRIGKRRFQVRVQCACSVCS